MMQKIPSIKIITHEELQTGVFQSEWNDPHRIGEISEEKKLALLSNPFLLPNDPVQILGLIGDRVIGRLDIIVSKLHVKGQPNKIYYGSYLYVEEEFRPTGIGLMLMLKLQSLGPIVAACGISQMVYPLYQKLRWTEIILPRFVLVRQSRAILESVIGYKWIANSVAKVVDLALLMHYLVLRFYNSIVTADLTVIDESSMPEFMNQYLCPPSNIIAPDHSLEWYNWILRNKFDSDGTRNVKLSVIYNSSETPIGFFVTKLKFYETATQRKLRNITIGSLQDWMIFDPKSISLISVIILASQKMFQSGVDAFEVAVPEKSVANQLKKAGFVSAGFLQFFFRAAPGSELTTKQHSNVADWSVKPADGDNFFN